MKTRRILFVSIQLALGVSILSVAILLLLDHFKIIETVKPFVVMSGSMNPAVRLGSVVVVRPESSYRPGDIITYAPDGNKENPITHRIVFRKFPEGPTGEPVFITAGDANDDFDSVQVGPANVIGRVQFSIPYLGYLVSLAKQPYGFILFVIVPATIVIYEELKILFGEFRRSGSKMFSWVRSKRKAKDPSGPDQRQRLRTSLSINLLGGKEKSFPKAGAFIPVIGTILVLAAFTSAFYSDEEKSSGNIFGAAESFGPPPPPIAQTLVINEILYDTNCPNPENKQWIELWNGSSITVDLKDWSLRDQDNNTIQIVNAVTLLAPGQFALLSKSNATWTQCYGDLLPGTVTSNLGGTINIQTTSGTIKLLDSGLNVVDRVDYGTGVGLVSGVNRSLERKILGQDSVTGDNFAVGDFEVRAPATAAFALPQNQDIVINEFLVNDGSAGQGKDWVEIYNKTGTSIDISGWTLRDTTGTFHTFPASTSILAAGFFDSADFSNRLNNGGDKIYVFDSGGFLKDGVSYFMFVPPTGTSIGRTSDGSMSWSTFSTPTKGATNTSPTSAWP